VASGHPLLGRDTGPPSARTSSKGALVPETHAVLHALSAGATMEAVRDDCLAGRLLKQRATETRRKIWNAIDWRLFAWNSPRWVQADLCEAARGPAPDPGFISMAYLHYARRDRLTFDFVTRHVWQMRESRQRLERSDVIEFLADYEEQLKRARPWRTRERRSRPVTRPTRHPAPSCGSSTATPSASTTTRPSA
jgi:BrxA